MKLVILDRDGVINQDADDYVKSVEEWQPIPGSIEAIAQLYQSGFTIVVATNQSGLSRGLFDLEALESMHAKLNTLVESKGGQVTAIFYCPHHPEDNCNCRKPKAGLIDVIEAELAISAAGCPLVGDTIRDLQAGISKGCDPFLVKTGKGTDTYHQLRQHPDPKFDDLKIFDDLAAAAHYIIENY